MTMRLSDVRINEPIPASEFAVDLPHGAWASDNICGTRYQVDSSGKRISDETPIEKLVAAAMADEPSAQRRGEFRGPSTEEEPGYWLYVWWGSGGLMVLLFLFWFWQRQRG